MGNNPANETDPVYVARNHNDITSPDYIIGSTTRARESGLIIGPNATPAQIQAQLNLASTRVGFDPPGGTSYGRYQMASVAGTPQAFTTFLQNHSDPHARTIGNRLADAPGEWNTGTTTGGKVDEWQKIANEGGFEGYEHDFMVTNAYGPAVNQLHPDLQAYVQRSKTFQDLAWSSVNAHGPAGGPQVMNTAYALCKQQHGDAFTNKQYIETLQDYRPVMWSHHTWDIQQTAGRFMREEKATSLANIDKEGLGEEILNGDLRQSAARLEEMRQMNIQPIEPMPMQPVVSPGITLGIPGLSPKSNGGGSGRGGGGGTVDAPVPGDPEFVGPVQETLNDYEPGTLSARYESSTAGSVAIGWDSTGGTSYGKYQIASRPGSMDSFIDYARTQGPEGQRVAETLSAAGPADTGSRRGAMPDAWRQMARSGQLGNLEHGYIRATHYEPVLGNLPQGLQDQIAGSNALKDVVWSTAVQHGVGGGTSVLTQSWREGMSNEDFARSVYEERGTRFGSSTPEVQASVQRRFRSEQGQALEMLAAERAAPTVAPTEGPAVDPAGDTPKNGAPATGTTGQTLDPASPHASTLTINLGQPNGMDANALSVDDVSPEGQMSVSQPADVRVRMMSSLVGYGVGQSINRFFGGSQFGHALGAMGGGTMAEFLQTNQMQSLATIQAFAGDVLKAAASIVSNVRVKVMGNEVDAHGTGVVMSIGGPGNTDPVSTSMTGAELDSLGSSLTDPKNHEGFNAYVDHEHDLDMGAPGPGNRRRLETQGLAMPNVESISRPGLDDFDDDPALAARSTGTKQGMGPGMSGPGMMGPGRGMA